MPTTYPIKTKREKCLLMLQQDPTISTAVIAERVGTSTHYVTVLAREAGLQRPRESALSSQHRNRAMRKARIKASRRGP